MGDARELLELAAKAAGIYEKNTSGGLYFWVFGADAGMVRTDNFHSRIFESWNPLTDDGDALRLAVKLKFDICHDNNDTEKSGKQIEHVNVWPFNGGLGSSEDLGKDPYAATRRAIVRTAAEIGSGMRPFPSVEEIKQWVGQDD